MSLQNKFSTFIRYVIIQLVTNNNIIIRDYDRDVNSVKPTLKDELDKHNYNFELAIESTAKLLAENEYIISQIKIMYPDKYTEDITNHVTNHEEEEDNCDEEDFYNFIISYAGLYELRNLHPDETSKMCNKLFTLLSQ
jgi:hypothetical protein